MPITGNITNRRMNLKKPTQNIHYTLEWIKYIRPYMNQANQLQKNFLKCGWPKQKKLLINTNPITSGLISAGENLNLNLIRKNFWHIIIIRPRNGAKMLLLPIKITIFLLG